ncbi:MAG: acyltransferase family protein [Anaerohalosphaeraceae bacterium]
MAKESDYSLPFQDRLLSLDFFRGLTMFLLIAEGTLLFEKMVDPAFEGTLLGALGTQFHHHPWHGLRFWDLVQPFFMFIVGVALPFSVARRVQRGEGQSLITRHAVQRSLLLLLMGWMLGCIGSGAITFQFQNVLCQLSVTYLIAFLMMNKTFRVQLIFTFFLLLISEGLYRCFPVDGFNQPFTPDHNLGAYVDLLISGELSQGHWVSFNAIPTTAHTLWGVMAGQLLMSDKTGNKKTLLLIGFGLIGLVAGYSLDSLTPIIKRIATSSFVIASGGWCLLAIALSYWLIDVRKIHRGIKFFVIVGMNPLFIYLFSEIGGGRFLYRIPKPFTLALLAWAGDFYAAIAASFVTLAMLWYICYWLYKRKIFIKI